MPSGNRGEFIPSNYRPTPRIARAVSDFANQTLLNNEGANRTLGAYMPRMNPSRAQSFINSYRTGRDYEWHPPMVDDPVKSSLSAMAPEKAETIVRAISMSRRNK